MDTKEKQYKPLTHFRDCIKAFQAKQEDNNILNDQEYEALCSKIDEDHIDTKEITKEYIYNFLKKKYYKNE